MKPKFIDYYMSIAKLTAQLSYAKRLQVGAVIVKGNQILSSGYNGMPSGWENICEITIPEHIDPETRTITPEHVKSKPEVMHAERNALDKVAASNESTQGAVIFCTHSPCLECAKSIYNTGITTVYYQHEYRSNDGIEFLKKTGVHVKKYSEPEISV
jgi:dCMP deaminase